jgi:hypothetical protein
MSFEINETDMNSLDEPQKLAVIEALLLGVLANGKPSKEEIARFDAISERIPWGLDRAALVNHMESARTRIVALAKAGDRDKILELIGSVATRLPMPLREKTFHAIASVMWADGAFVPDEKNVLSALALAFQLTLERVDAIKKSLDTAT